MELIGSLRKLVDHMLHYGVNFVYENMLDEEMMLQILETSHHDNYTGTRQFIYMQNAC